MLNLRINVIEEMIGIPNQESRRPRHTLFQRSIQLLTPDSPKRLEPKMIPVNLGVVRPETSPRERN